MTQSRNHAEHNAVEAFIDRWRDTGGKERANYQLFLTELCQLLALPGPEPAGPDPKENAYVFERRVDIHHADGSVNRGYIDLYRRGHFVLEAKQVSEKHESGRWDKARLRGENIRQRLVDLSMIRTEESVNRTVYKC